MKARYVLLASLYTSQFLPLGFFYIALTAVLRREGVSLERIGLIHLLALLWVLKSLWAPVIDRYGWQRLGHYRGWLLLLQGLMVLGVLALIPIDVVRQPILLFALVAVIAFLSATQDVAVDAVAVRLLEVSERGPANGIQIAAGNLGFVIGGGGLLLVFDHLGWGPAVGTLAVLTAAPLLPVIQYLSPEETSRSEDERSQVSLAKIGGFFKQPGVGRWIWAVVPFFYLGVAIPHKLITPMLVDAGWPLGRIGTVAAIGGGTIAMLAAVGGGVLLGRRRRRAALLIIGVVQLTAIGAAVPLAAGTRHLIAGLVAIILLNVGYAATGAAVFTVNMDWSRPYLAGTDYALLSSWAIIWSDVLGAVGLSVAGVIGYGWITAAAAATSLIGLTSVARIFRAQPGIEPSPAASAAV
jgi:MFS family permease